MTDFVRFVPLDVYRLNAGFYHYSINGRHLGSFDLAEYNKFVGECGGTNNPEERCEIKNTATSIP